MRRSVLLLTLSALLALPACGGDDPADPVTPVVIVTEDVTVDTTWVTGTVYWIQAYDFYVEATLTIQPGVVVKFDTDKGPDLSLGDNGRLLAQGTEAAPIVFTSFRDDSAGGDTNGDGDLTVPAPADWGRVSTNGHPGSVFRHVHVRYGGDNAYHHSLAIDDDATVDACTFTHNVGGRFECCYYGALDASGAPGTTTITNNVFYGNVLPLSIPETLSLDDSNVFTNPADATEGNTMNGVFLQESGEFETAITWGETEVPFVINDNDLWVNPDASLTLGDDVVIKFTADAALVYDGGNLLNHDGPGVAFTSFKDDSQKGDTNGDGATTAPGDGDWNGVYNDSEAVSDYESWANISYDSH